MLSAALDLELYSYAHLKGHSRVLPACAGAGNIGTNNRGNLLYENNNYNGEGGDKQGTEI